MMILAKQMRWVVRNEHGMALIITISIIALLVGITTAFALKARYNYFASTTFIDGAQLDAMTLSGINIGMLALELDGAEDETDTLNDVWAADKQNELGGLFNRGELELQIIDETGRLQINLIADKSEDQAGEDTQEKTVAAVLKQTLKNLLLSDVIGVENETAADEIVDSLVDWIDADDDESEYGAEGAYYKNLQPPYDCKNGPVDRVQELLKVKGITKTIYYGSNGRKGLKDFVTVYKGDGKININTVDPDLLQAMQPSVTDDMKNNFDIFRREPENAGNLKETNWYKGVDGWPGDVGFPGDILTVKSSCFRLTATGRFNDLSRTRQVYAARSGKDLVVLDKAME